MLIKHFSTIFFLICCMETLSCAQEAKSEMGAVSHLLKNIALNLQTSNSSHDILSDFSINGFDLDNENTTNPCLRDLFRVVTSLQEQWALEMIDSDGKPDSGLLKGNVIWAGDYDECMGVLAPSVLNSSSNHSFRGRYCKIAWAGTSNVSISMSPFSSLETGICVPHTCDSATLKNYTQVLYNLFNPLSAANNTVPFGIASISCKPLTRVWDTQAIAVLCILSLFGLFVILGTGITVFEKFQPKTVDCDDAESASEGKNHLISSAKEESDIKKRLSGMKNFLQCFCVLTNTERLMRIQKSETQREDLSCIHGIRFLSMAWVILGHTYIFAISGSVRNIKDLSYVLNHWLFQIVLQGPFSVDSFFLMSGFLLSYVFLKQMNKRDGKMSWPYFYLHRYWRLTPVYAIVLAFDTTLSKYLASGPFWSETGTDTPCETLWWRNLLYINNFGDFQNQCMGWSWYLANDMQFYVISPLFLYPLWRWPKAGVAVIIVLLSSSWIVAAVITSHFELYTGFSEIANFGNGVISKGMENLPEYMQKIYSKPYTRIGPYLIGALLAYVTIKSKEKLLLRQVWRVVGWILSFGFFAISIFVLYHVRTDIIGASFYNALIRSVFALALAWVIFACLKGYGGYVNSILSYEFFAPLGKLTYCAYLVHPIIITAYYQSLRTTLYITNSTMVMYFFGFLVASYGVAFVTSLVFEAPLLLLEKRLIKAIGLVIN